MYRYINPGRIALFQNPPNSYLEKTDNQKSKTGVGFQCNNDLILPDIPANTKEMWAKMDYHCLSNAELPTFLIYSQNTYCSIEQSQVRVNGTRYNLTHDAINAINTVWLHIKSNATEGLFEIWVNGTKKYEFTGNVLQGEDIIQIKLHTNTFYDRYTISNIIVSDSVISLTEQVVTIPCNITTDMTDNQDGSYSATAVNQYLNFTIDSSISSTYADGTRFTGANIAARNCIRDGEGVENLNFLEGNTSLDTQSIPTAENCGLSHGVTLNSETINSFLQHSYKLVAR